MADRADKFFTFVRRFNSIALMLLLVLAVVLIGFNFSEMFLYRRTDYRPPTVAGGNTATENLHLRNFRSVEGERLLYAELSTSDSDSGLSSGFRMGDARNLLFFDIDRQKSHWLFDGNNQVIASYVFLMDRASNGYVAVSNYGGGRVYDDKDPRIATVMIVFSRPLDVPTGTMSIGSADGRHLISVASGVDRIEGYWQTASNSALVFYDAAGLARVMQLDLVTQTVKSDGPLSPEDRPDLVRPARH